MNPKILLRWHQMSEREQGTWTAVFAQQTAPTFEAASIADRAVELLRGLDIDQDEMAPEHAAARAGFHFTLDEFVGWYRVALKLQRGHEFSYRDPNQAECELAYETYLRGRSDFY